MKDATAPPEEMPPATDTTTGASAGRWVSLRTTILIALISSGLLLSVASAWLHRINLREVLAEESLSRGQAMLRLIRTAAEMSHDDAELQRLVSAAGAERSVQTILLAHGNPARIGVATQGSWIGQPLTEVLPGSYSGILSEVTDSKDFIDDAHASEDFARIILAGNYLLPGRLRTPDNPDHGTILLALDNLADFGPILDRATLVAFGRGCALTFTLTMLVFLMVQRRILVPLEAISGVLRRRRAEDAGLRVPSRFCTTDEIGEVARSLNRSFDDIDELNRTRDQHEQDLAEVMLAMKRVDERLSLLLSGISAMVYAGRPDGQQTTFVGANAQRVTGYSVQDFMADPGLWARRLHPHDAPEIISKLRTRYPGARLVMEYRFRHSAGHYIWLHDDSRHVPARDGQPAEIIGFVLDVSDRKRAERELRESDLKFEALIEALPQWAWAVGPDGVVEIIGSKASEYLGLTSRQITNAAWMGYLHPEDRARVLEALRLAQDTGEPFAVDFRLRRTDGVYRWFSSTGAPMRDEDGRIIRWVGSIFDITDRRSAEEQLRESQKMEAIGQLTGGLAHDFNNLLGVVVGNLDMLADELPPDDERARRHHQTALDAALRGAEVTMSLLAVARRQPLEIGNHDVSTLVLEMLPLMRASAGSGVKVLTQLPAGPLIARLDARGFSNVVLNLVINARDAMADQTGEKRIIIRLRKAVVKPESTLGLVPGSYAVIEVSDTGPGMSAKVRAQAFEPFFTTKARDKGTGLGLSMVHGYAEQVGGTARIESTEGEGATVRVYLPLDPAAAAAEEQDEQGRLDALRSLKILDTPPEAAFDALVLEAARICGTAIAVISLVDEHRQWFKARLGLQVDETPREDAFCAHAIQTPGEVMVVNDAAADPRFAANPLVLDEPKIRFYAGVPLVDERGRGMGTLCVIDRTPLSLSEAQKVALQELGDEISLMMRLKAPVRDRPSKEPLEETGPGMLVDTSSHVRILVVDDEAGMCDLACGWLRELEYDAVPALGGEEALKLLRSRRFDVLFTDVVMPGSLDGLSLSRQARRLQPQLKILFTSGYARNIAAELEQIGPLLSKPYRKHHLVEAMQRLLGGESRQR